ncbi:MAG: protein kinase [Myxococcota bacterium]
MEVLAGREIAGRYRLRRRIGAGGMGEVWVARHLELEVDMAVKLIAPDRVGSASAERRFRREARAAARLRSPFIATIHDFGRAGGLLFLVMELLQGHDLSAYLEDGPMKRSEALYVLSQLGRALEVIHASDVVHRDVKPSNVFLAEHGGDVTTKLLDFGIAKMLEGQSGDDDRSTTATGVRVGSPGYMSPEQIVGDAITRRSDLWSLACLGYVMLAGEQPFHGRDPGRQYAEVSAGNVRPLVIEGIDSAPLMAVFRRSLSLSPDARFSSPTELVEALREALGGVEPEMPEPRVPSPSRCATGTKTLPPPEDEALDASPDRASGAEAPRSRDSSLAGRGEARAPVETTSSRPKPATASAPRRRTLAWGLAAGLGTLLSLAYAYRSFSVEVSASMSRDARALPALLPVLSVEAGPDEKSDPAASTAPQVRPAPGRVARDQPTATETTPKVHPDLPRPRHVGSGPSRFPPPPGPSPTAERKSSPSPAIRDARPGSVPSVDPFSGLPIPSSPRGTVQ